MLDSTFEAASRAHIERRPQPDPTLGTEFTDIQNRIALELSGSEPKKNLGDCNGRRGLASPSFPHSDSHRFEFVTHNFHVEGGWDGKKRHYSITTTRPVSSLMLPIPPGQFRLLVSIDAPAPTRETVIAPTEPDPLT